MFEAHIVVRLKKGITDPEGTNTLKALHLLGFENVQQAQTTRMFNLVIDAKDKTKVQKEVEQMCQRLLTNPVIHEFDITIKEITS